MFAHTLPHISSDIPGSMRSIPPLGKTLVRKAATGFTCAYDNTEHMNSSTIGLFSTRSSSRTSTGSVPRERDERAQGHSRGIRGKCIERAPPAPQLRPRLAHPLDRAVDVRVAALPPDGGAGAVRESEEGERASQAGDDLDLRETVAGDARSLSKKSNTRVLSSASSASHRLLSKALEASLHIKTTTGKPVRLF
ncbi:uncharacterized protein SCHCODRAFT_02603346 [Schizophyllum commune H4-8]|uniref:Expressed protein n=1 Tax=Schizophyllum commune (strain H4-8 / FGSC 9210) TaxID=578458 RepID=D8QIW5_SCHCM|nr:uncharacterized protein SCHCODRAFT_02603346 [Schizophyllum commune H4-8]KAI5886192.1 hypothetical protein SCHCODRAFT_02603346 [Schizophyllum commune H4-8]